MHRPLAIQVPNFS